MTSSCHRFLGLPTGLVPVGFQSYSILVGLAWSILRICPSHLILCALMNLTISAPSIELSICMLFRILHVEQHKKIHRATQQLGRVRALPRQMPG